MCKNKNILLIVFHFYPDTAIGAIRSEKFVKFLPELDWNPFVLTVKNKYFRNKSDEQPDFKCPIYRTGKLPILGDFYRKFKSWQKRNNNSSSNDQEHSKLAGDKKDYSSTNVTSNWKKYINILSSIPDEHMGWIIPATIKAIRLIRKNKIDIIYSSSPPHTCHIIALLVKMFTNCKWVADFRDPWSMAIKSGYVDVPIYRKIENYLEKRVILKADMIISTTVDIQKSFQGLYPEIDKEKYFTVYNGYDEAEMPDCPKPDNGKGYVQFLYAGNLWGGRDPYALIEAVGVITCAENLDLPKIRIDFYGTFEIDPQKTDKSIDKYELRDNIAFNKPVKRTEYLNIISKADILILMQGPLQSTCIPAKTFEYLATGNSILALVTPGATADFLSKFKNVEMAHPYKNDEIETAILQILKNYKDRLSLDPEHFNKLQKYTRKNQTIYLAELLNKRCCNN